MENIKFEKAYFIKLGRGGMWEESSIRENKARIGWKNWALAEINRGYWDETKEKHQEEFKNMRTSTSAVCAADAGGSQ